MHYAIDSFLSSGFTIATLMNPPDEKLVHLSYVQWSTEFIYRRIIAVQVGIIWMVMFVVGMFMNGEYVFSIGFQSCQSTGQGFDFTIDIKRVNIGQFKS